MNSTAPSHHWQKGGEVEAVKHYRNLPYEVAKQYEASFSRLFRSWHLARRQTALITSPRSSSNVPQLPERIAYEATEVNAGFITDQNGLTLISDDWEPIVGIRI